MVEAPIVDFTSVIRIVAVRWLATEATWCVLATVGVSNLVDHGVHRFVTGKAEADADAALSISVVLNQVAESEDAATAAVVIDTAGWVKMP